MNTIAAAALTTIAVATGICASPSATAAESPDFVGNIGSAQGGANVNTAATQVVDSSTEAQAAGSYSNAEPDAQAIERDGLPMRATMSICEGIADLGGVSPTLVDACNELSDLDCEDGQTPVGSAYEYTATNTLTRPEDVPDARQTAEAFCAVDAQDLADAARKEFRSMRIDPSPITAKPDAEWTVINIHNPVNTADVPRTRDVTLLGIDVQIRAVPTRFTWTFGDGTAPLVTDDPGREWTPAHGDPDQTWIGHTYTDPGTYTVELTTTWHGQFRITGTPTWTDIPGEAETTTPGPTWQALEMRSVLIDGTGE